jgi:Sigma-70 region 2
MNAFYRKPRRNQTKSGGGRVKTMTFRATKCLVKRALVSMSGGRANFATTQWGVVNTASSEDPVEARAALEALYRTYCYPIYAFIRRRGYDRQDAQDLTQDFFVHLLQKDALSRAERQRGRFRSFLLGALDNFLAHAAERASARKRGGDCHFGVGRLLRYRTSPEIRAESSEMTARHRVHYR